MTLGECSSPACLSKEEDKNEDNFDSDSVIPSCIDLKDPLSIKVLNLSKQALSEIKFDLSPLKNVTELDLSHNKLKDLPVSLNSLARLCVLNLSHNQFKSPPEILLTSFPILKNLDLSHNFLAEFPKPPLCLPILETLDLSHNCLHAPLGWLISSSPGLLKSLNLEVNNCFEGINCEKQLQGQTPCLVSNVINLHLSSCAMNINKLKYLKNFPHLKSLHLGNTVNRRFNVNLFEDFDLDCLPTDALTELYLPNCGLAGFPRNLEKLKRLEVLDVSQNQFYWLLPTFGTLKHLRVLNLFNCSLVSLPQLNEPMANLQELYLSRNDINSLPEAFLMGENLTVLDLYDNSLDQLPDFSKLTKLKALDVSLNHFDSPESIEIGSEQLQYKDLRENLIKQYLNNQTRSSERKFEEVPNESDDDGGSSECSGSLRNFASYDNNADDEDALNECWDDVILSHDQFIPYSIQMESVSYDNDLSLENKPLTPYDIMKSEHFFLPFSERSTVVVATAGYNAHIEEGQFDDC